MKNIFNEIVEWPPIEFALKVFFRISKSRNLLMQKVRCFKITPFSVGGIEIPSLQNNPVKSLGRIIDRSLTNRKSKDELWAEVKDGLKVIDKSLVTGGMEFFAH